MKMNKKGRRTGITMNKKLGSTLIAMTIIIFMLFLTLGMFTKNFGGSASAEVASAQTSVDGEILKVNDDGTLDADDTGEYFFSVKNTDKDGNKVSEVTMKYTLVVETEQTDTNNPVTVKYELCPAKYDETSKKYVVDESIKSTVGTDKGNNEWEFLPTADIPMKLELNTKKEAQVDNYILKFTPENDGQFKFKVKVISEQVN